jgi:hypothetical protein
VFSLATWPADNTPIMKEISENAKFITDLIKSSIDIDMNVTRTQSKYDCIFNIHSRPNRYFNIGKYKQAVEVLYLIE